MTSTATEKTVSKVASLSRARSTSLCPSTSTASTDTIDSSTKITILDSPIGQTTWCTDVESDLMNVEEFKIKSSQAKYWKSLQKDVKAYVARIKSDAVANKFEIDIKVIGR